MAAHALAPCYARSVAPMILTHKQRVLTPRHQGWNDLHSLCRIGMGCYLLNDNDDDNNNNNNNNDNDDNNNNNNNNNDDDNEW